MSGPSSRFQGLLMLLDCRSTITRSIAFGALFLAALLGAQSPDTVSYVTTQGKDTTAIEQYVRVGHTITGAWIQHQGDALVHNYAMVLGANGWPAHYVMSLYTPRTHTFLVSVTYGPDSATRIMVRDSAAVTMRVPTIRAYPIAAISVLAWDLALARARAPQTDTSTIVVEHVEVPAPAQTLAVKFLGSDSVSIGSGIWARVDRNGRLLALRDGSRETRRVSSLDVAKLVAAWNAADAAAKAARVAIALSPAALQRFVGEYSLNPSVALVVTLDGNTLVLRAGKQPPIKLFAQSPTTFYMESTTAVTFEFDTDAAGNVVGLTLVQGHVRQRATRKKQGPI